jgi:hypothetical protein
MYTKEQVADFSHFLDNRTFARQYSPWQKIKFWIRIGLGSFRANRMMRETLKRKECYYGSFKGEFGHLLAHNLPFLSFLHRRGVKIHYCGVGIHRSLLVDEQNQSIVASFHELRDFFSEVTPCTNNTVAPADVQYEIDKFAQKAIHSGLPFWNIGDDSYYWFIHRNHILKRKWMHGYHLEKVFESKRTNSAVIFPRSKGTKSSENNGGAWDYQDLAEKIAPYFERVYICGHPSQVLQLEAKDNIELCITADNAEIAKHCANSKLIITQHSGVNNLGEYLNTKVLIIYNGKPPIGSMQNTLRFRPFLVGQGKERQELAYAFKLDEVLNFVRSMC